MYLFISQPSSHHHHTTTLSIIMSSTERKCLKLACPVLINCATGRKKYCSESCYPSRARKKAPSASPVQPRLASSPDGRPDSRRGQASPKRVATRLRTRVSSVTPRPSPGRRASHDSTQSNSSRHDTSWAPSPPPTARWPPERDKGTPISLLQDNTIMLATPLPTAIYCSTCGPSTRWSGRACLSGAIRHFSLAHGKKAKVQIECSRCCHVSNTVQASRKGPHAGHQAPRHDETHLKPDDAQLQGMESNPPGKTRDPPATWRSWLPTFQQKLPALRMPSGDHHPRPQRLPQWHGRNDGKT